MIQKGTRLRRVRDGRIYKAVGRYDEGGSAPGWVLAADDGTNGEQVRVTDDELKNELQWRPA